MHALTPIPPRQFDRLVDHTEPMRKAELRRGHWSPLIVRTPQQKADGLWRDTIFLPADAVIIEAIDMLVARGLPRPSTKEQVVLDEIQLCIIGALNSLDHGWPVQLCFARDNGHFIVVTAETTPEATKVAFDHFAERGVANPDKLSLWVISLREAYDTVKARAAKHRIDFPDHVWLTPEEWDAGAKLVAAAIAPRVSPIIEQWQANRAAEAESRRAQKEGRLA